MPLALLLGFVVLPLVEIYLISLVGHVLGLPATLAVLLLVSVLGATVVKREGLRTWRELRSATAAGKLPTRPLADGALVLVGGALLLTPGFLTDALGALLVLPATRSIARRWLTGYATRRALGESSRMPRGRRRPGGPSAASARPRPGEGVVLEGQVIEDVAATERTSVNGNAIKPRSR